MTIAAAIKVGAHGFVRYVDHMGNDQAVVQAARVSYGEGTKSISDDKGLIRYLMRHKHTSPFEMCEIKLHIKIPMEIWRQMVRHRTASINEYSTRYSIALDDYAEITPNEWRLQSKSNKQGSEGLLIEQNNKLAEELYQSELLLHNIIKDEYRRRIEVGIAREQARKILPLDTYTMVYWKIDLHNLFHFLKLRLAPEAQQEIREFAEAIYSIVKKLFPICSEAFEDYVLNAKTFSKQEMNCLKKLLESCIELSEIDPKAKQKLLETFIPNSREQKEFIEKIER